MAEIAQKWLEKKYNSEVEKNTTTIKRDAGTELEGELKIDEYPNLKEIFLVNTKGITKLTITNCPEVEMIFVHDNQITKIDGLENLKKLTKLNLGANRIKEIDISKNTQLKMLNLRDNPIDEFKSAGGLKDLHRLVHWNSEDAFPLAALFDQASEEDLKKLAEKLKLDVGGKTPTEIEKMVDQEIGKSILIKAELKRSFPGLLDSEGEIDEDKLEEIVGKIEKIKELVTDNPDLTTDNVIDQAKINDLKNAIKNILGVALTDPLPETWKTDLETKLKEFGNHIDPNKLEEAAKKAGFGFKQEDIDNAVKAEREKMVSKDDYDKIVAERDARPNTTLTDYQKLQDNQEKHTDEDLEKHQPEDLRPANLPDKWESELKKIPTLEANQKPADYDKNKSDLKKWTDKFPGKDPEKVEKELNDLKSKPAGGTTPSAEQKQKIDELMAIIKKQNAAIRKYGSKWQSVSKDTEWRNEIEDISKLNK